jgi:transcriptional regulator with XRE-family HTH domain
MENIADSARRVRAVRKAMDLSQNEFAKKLGISQRKMSRIETTQDLDRTTAKLFEHVFNVSEKWLMNGTGEEPNWDKLGDLIIDFQIKRLAKQGGPRRPYDDDGPHIHSSVGIDVPIFDAVPSMGGGQLADQQEMIIGNLPIPYEIFDSGGFRRYKKENLAAFRAEGDSMTPTISSGDFVVVNFDPNYRGDGIYLVQLYESLLIKRLQRQLDNTILLISDNPSYREQTVTEADEGAFRLHGRLLWVSHMLSY